MDIKIYSAEGCFYCEQMKELCKRAEVDYEYVTVEKDITKDEFVALFPNALGYPHVIIDGEELGGLVEAAKYFIKEGLVSARKD